MQDSQLGSTCNGKIFIYDGSQTFIIIYLVLSLLVALYLLIKTMKLCSIAFSYSNFHVHETYRLYVLGIVNLLFIIFSRKVQWDLKNYKDSISETDITLKGYELVNDIFGVLSIFSNNYMHIYNGFTWLLISLSCDYTTTKERSTLQEDEQVLAIEQKYLKSSKEVKRKRIYYLKSYIINCLLMAMLGVSIFGTLNHADGDNWCAIVSGLVVASSFLPLIVFGVALFFYIRQFWDPEISWITKAGLIYLIVAMVIRALYFLVCSLKNNDLIFGGDWLSLCYTIFCTLAPIFVMSVLGQKQLKQQQYIRTCPHILSPETIIVVLQKHSVMSLLFLYSIGLTVLNGYGFVEQSICTKRGIWWLYINQK